MLTPMVVVVFQHYGSGTHNTPKKDTPKNGNTGEFTVQEMEWCILLFPWCC